MHKGSPLCTPLSQPSKKRLTVPKIIQSSGKYIYRAFIIILILLAGLAILSTLNPLPKYQLFVVQSGSMEPTVPAGSLIIVDTQGSYAINDVITFKTKPEVNIKDPKNLITHRIVAITREEGGTFYVTQGDANNAPDRAPVYPETILGKVVTHIPYLGLPVSFAKTQTGFIILVVIPATIIVYSELLTIKSEAKKILTSRQQKKSTEKTVNQKKRIAKKSKK